MSFVKYLVIGALALLLGACSSSPGDKDTGTGDGKGPVGDALGDGGGPDQTKASQVGQPCQQDGECQSNICFKGKCAKACTDGAGCEAGQDCGSDDGKRLLCHDATYDKAIGVSCVISGTCGGTTKCFGVGGSENAEAYCSGECTDDMGCPPRYSCREMADKKKYCVARGFCTRCLHDGQCAEGSACIQQGQETFCSRPCNPGSTECPRYAKCQEVMGKNMCVHSTGSCVGDGAMCSACTVEEDCEAGGLCLTYTFSKESFCASGCASGTCPTGNYKCEEIAMSATSATKQCVPADEKAPSCVGTLSPTMEVGDTIDDFAMVGFADNNRDGALTGEKLRVIRFSDYATDTTTKIIFFNVSAGWCVPCQNETKQFKALWDAYADKGLMIVQTLFDSDKPGGRPTVALLNAWVNAFAPAGACGIDPSKNSMAYNTAGTTPMNMIIDAKTRKVLDKFNSFNAAQVGEKIKQHLGL